MDCEEKFKHGWTVKKSSNTDGCNRMDNNETAASNLLTNEDLLTDEICSQTRSAHKRGSNLLTNEICSQTRSALKRNRPAEVLSAKKPSDPRSEAFKKRVYVLSRGGSIIGQQGWEERFKYRSSRPKDLSSHLHIAHEIFSDSESQIRTVKNYLKSSSKIVCRKLLL